MTVAKQPPLPAELIDSLLSGYKKPEDLIGEHGLLKQLTKALVERALEAEMEAHLGHARSEAVTNPSGNTRNGKSRKMLKGEFGELPVEIPRDRNGVMFNMPHLCHTERCARMSRILSLDAENCHLQTSWSSSIGLLGVLRSEARIESEESKQWIALTGKA